MAVAQEPNALHHLAAIEFERIAIEIERAAVFGAAAAIPVAHDDGFGFGIELTRRLQPDRDLWHEKRLITGFQVLEEVEGVAEQQSR